MSSQRDVALVCESESSCGIFLYNCHLLGVNVPYAISDMVNSFPSNRSTCSQREGGMSYQASKCRIDTMWIFCVNPKSYTTDVRGNLGLTGDYPLFDNRIECCSPEHSKLSEVFTPPVASNCSLVCPMVWIFCVNLTFQYNDVMGNLGLTWDYLEQDMFHKYAKPLDGTYDDYWQVKFGGGGHLTCKKCTSGPSLKANLGSSCLRGRLICKYIW